MILLLFLNLPFIPFIFKIKNEKRSLFIMNLITLIILGIIAFYSGRISSFLKGTEKQAMKCLFGSEEFLLSVFCSVIAFPISIVITLILTIVYHRRYKRME
jgi:hypothetical protein